MARISRTYVPIKAVIFFIMDAFDQAPLILPKMQDQISLMLCWHSGDAHFPDVVGPVSIRFLHIKAANMPKMNHDIPIQYFTINSSIAECDYICETRNAESEIGPDGFCQIRGNPRIDGNRSWFGLPTVIESGSRPGLEPNRPVFAVQTWTAGGFPGPVANTRDDAARRWQYNLV